MPTNLLIVDPSGNEDWEKTKAYLSKRQWLRIHTVTSAGEAVKVVKAGNIDIVISNYDLKRTNPITFLKNIKGMMPHIEIIFLSNATPLPMAISAMKEGAYDFYEFPLNMNLLTTVIKKSIEKQALFYELKELEQRVMEKFELGNIIGRSKAMQHVITMIKSVASKDLNVLITGETGTGKELVANAIHYNSPRASKPFISVNCVALNQGVLESELFGHEKGAFTGAISQRIGRFELANGGTLFLDEIGELSSETQVKLLRVLQERKFERVGGNQTVEVNVRILAATNRQLEDLMNEGRFRKDLYYRINVVHVDLPPLRERKVDVSILVSYFINKINEEKGYGFTGITKDAMRAILNYSWPGNVRELENAIEAAMALSEGPMIEEKYLPAFMLLSPSRDGEFIHLPVDMSLDEMNKEIIHLALEKTGGNKSRAARMLGIGLRTLQRKAKLFQ